MYQKSIKSICGLVKVSSTVIAMLLKRPSVIQCEAEKRCMRERERIRGEEGDRMRGRVRKRGTGRKRGREGDT